MRGAVTDRAAKALNLIQHFPAVDFRGQTVAGFWPIGDEIDIRPLLMALSEQGARLCLPVTPRKGHPLRFYDWTPHSEMVTSRYGTYEPKYKGEPATLA